MGRELLLSYGVCGLYCNICDDKKNGECHGCECPGHDCAASWHQQHCRIYRCAKAKGYETCAECDDMPCSMLNAFCCDTKWPLHLQALNNLSRIKKIGLKAWADEQAAYWADPDIQP